MSLGRHILFFSGMAWDGVYRYQKDSIESGVCFVLRDGIGVFALHFLRSIWFEGDRTVWV